MPIPMLRDFGMVTTKSECSAWLLGIRAALRGHEYERALWLAEQEARGHPEDAVALSYVGRLKATLRRDRQHALDPCQRAFALAPLDAQVATNLAWAHYLCGHEGPAREALDRALQLDDTSADALALAKRLSSPRPSKAAKPAPPAAAGAGLWGRLKDALARR